MSARRIEPDFDPDALARYLGPGELRLDPVASGQSNPTWFVTHGARRMVLRKKPSGAILKGAHAVEREYRVMAALQGSGVAVPKVIALEEDAGIIGTPFYLMERLEGRVFEDTALPEMGQGDRGVAFANAARSLAALHRFDWAESLGDYGRPGGFFARQIKVWGGQMAELDHPEAELLNELTPWFAGNIPEDETTTLVHGDFRIGNLMFSPDGPGIVGVLDWELSALGHPLADLAHFALFYHLGPEVMGGLAGLDLAGLGIPEFEAFADLYREAGGTGAQMTPFHHAFGLYRMGAIFAGVGARARRGQAAAPDAARVGSLAPVCAAKAAEIVSGG